MALPQKRPWRESYRESQDLRQTLRPSIFRRMANATKRLVGRTLTNLGFEGERWDRWAREEHERVEADRFIPRFGYERRDVRGAYAENESPQASTLNYFSTHMNQVTLKKWVEELAMGTEWQQHRGAMSENLQRILRENPDQFREILTHRHMQEALLRAAGKYIAPRRGLAILTTRKKRVKNALLDGLTQAAESLGEDLTIRKKPSAPEPAPQPQNEAPHQPEEEPHNPHRETAQAQANAQATNVNVEGRQHTSAPVVIKQYFGKAGFKPETDDEKKRSRLQESDDAEKLVLSLQEFTRRQANADRVRDFAESVAKAHLTLAKEEETGEHGNATVAQKIWTGLTPAYSNSDTKKEIAKVLKTAGVEDHVNAARRLENAHRLEKGRQNPVVTTSETPHQRIIALGHQFKGTLSEREKGIFAKMVRREIARQSRAE